MQEAILAQMQDNEDMYIEEDEEEGASGNQEGGGIINFFN